jgi:hypothetical protein
MKQWMIPILIACSTYLLPRAALATEPFYKENTAYQWITQKYRFTHHLDFRLLPGVKSGMGGSYRLAYSLGEYAFDLQAAYDESSWGVIFPSGGLTLPLPSSPAADDPNSQLNLPRNASDPWRTLVIEAGISYRGRLVPFKATKWIQSSRISAGRLMLMDKANGLAFSGFGLNVEFSIWYQLLPKLLIGPTFGYRGGWAFLDGNPNVDTNRIPIRMLQTTFGTVFRF